MADLPADRARYQPSGKIAWLRFLPLALLALLGAAGGTMVLNYEYYQGRHTEIFSVLVAALIVSFLLRTAINVGRCRSPLVGGLLGLTAGIVLYIGFFYLGMLSETGVENAWKLNRLPQFINERMQSGGRRGFGLSDPLWNWNLSIAEMCIVFMMTAWYSFKRSGTAYCEKCDRWKKQEVALFPAGNGWTIRQWLEDGQLGQLASVGMHAIGAGRRFTAVAAELCPGNSDAQRCPVYLSIKDVSNGSSTTSLRRFDAAFGRTRVSRIELTPEEISQISPVFSHLAVLDAPVIAARPNPGAQHLHDLIEVRQLGPEESRIVAGRFHQVNIALTRLAIIAFLSSAWLAIVGTGFLALLPQDTHIQRELAIVAFLIALCVFLVGFRILTRNPLFFANRLLRARARRIFRRRADCCVDLSRECRLPTTFVTIIPRADWTKTVRRISGNAGFLQFDQENGEIRFEGGFSRFRIPITAIESCKLQAISAIRSSAIVFHLVVVSGHTEDGSWESPFCAIETRMRLKRDFREESALKLYNQFAAIEGAPLNVFDEATAAGKVKLQRHGSRLIPILTRAAVFLLPIAYLSWKVRGIYVPSSFTPPKVADVESSFAPALQVKLYNIRHEPLKVPGAPDPLPQGDWTVFDCALADDPQTVFTIGIQMPQPDPATGYGEGQVTIYCPDRDSGQRLVTALAKAFSLTDPPLRPQQPIKPLSLTCGQLGDNLSSQQDGFKTKGGTWVAQSWTDAMSSGDEAEGIYFNFDLSNGIAEFTKGTDEMSSGFILAMASNLRDGPLPDRSAQNDPTFTDAGPKFGNLVTIPNSLNCSATFVKGGKLVAILKNNGQTENIVGVRIADPTVTFPIANLNLIPNNYLFADPDANRILFSGVQTHSTFGIPDVNGHARIWWLDRKSGKETDITGPWSQSGSASPAGEYALSPDNRYLVVIATQVGTQTSAYYVVDLIKGSTITLHAGMGSLVGWAQTPDGIRAIFFLDQSTESSDKQPLTYESIDPATGHSSPLPVDSPGDPNISLDGRLRLQVHANESIDIIKRDSGAVTNLKFSDYDARYAVPGAFTWLNSRYIQFSASQMEFIDTTTMKVGNLPNGQDFNWIQYSDDFNWALIQTSNGIALAPLEFPPASKPK